MNRAMMDLVREFEKEDFDRPLPIQMVGRLEDEATAMPDSDVRDDILLLAALRKAAEKEGCGIDADLGFGYFLLTWICKASGIDPLPPYYECRKCGRIEFVPGVKDGFDLPEKTCCGEPMHRCGHRLPYEIMLPSIYENGFFPDILIPESFTGTALRVIREHYAEDGLYRPVVTKVHLDGSEPPHQITVTLIPADELMPELEEDGTWSTDYEYLYSEKGWKTIDLIPDSEKEALKELAAERGVSPSLDDLLAEPVLASVRDMLEDHMKERGRPLHRLDELNFSALLAMLGYERSIYAEDDPLFLDTEAAYTDLFTYRENVWDLITERIKPEFGIGNAFAARVTRLTRSGRYTNGRLDEGTKYLLRSLGIEEDRIEYLQRIYYLPAKSSLIISLMDKLQLAWYGMQGGC